RKGCHLKEKGDEARKISRQVGRGGGAHGFGVDFGGRTRLTPFRNPPRPPIRETARAIASAAAGAATIRLAAVRMPCSCTSSTAALTSGAGPKTSEVRRDASERNLAFA